MHYKELTYEEALEFYNRWGRTILIGTSPSEFYDFNKVKDKKSLDDCVKQYLNYHDGPVRFFLDQRTADRDRKLFNNNESKNMNKKLIRLTEGDLHRIVKESVNRILREVRDASVSDEEWNEIRNAYNASGLWRDSPSLDKKDDMDRMFDDREREYEMGTSRNHLKAEFSEPFNNGNIHDNSKRYNPYINYLARNSEKYAPQNGLEKEFGRGFGNSGDYLDLWKGHNGLS